VDLGGVPRAPSEELRTAIHCVTKRTKLDTIWEGVSVDTILEGIEHTTHILAFSDGDYTTNLPLEDVSDGRGTPARLWSSMKASSAAS
jgi:DMSO/TMAO reductase YedYZ molybdopterin-dependent catalytic subunit